MKYKAGQKYGRLTLVNMVGKNKHGLSVWECVCRCGNECVVATNVFRTQVPSCGCRRVELGREFGHSHNASRKLPNEEGGFNAIYTSYVKNAKNRGLHFDISRRRFKKIIAENCVYCGSGPSNLFARGPTIYKYNGIDRVDNSLGYMEGNIVSCCKYCNRAKQDAPVEEFMEWIDNFITYRTDNQ